MRRLGFIAGWILALCLVLVPAARAQEEKPVVRGYLFYSQTCPACHQTRTEVLPQLYRQFGQQLEIKAIDINADEANYRWLIACEGEYGVPEDEAAIPALFIGDQYMIGPSDIESQLPSLIQGYLDSGGVDFPDVARPGGPLEPTVRFMFFHSPSCPHCRNVEEHVFPKIREKYGDQVQWDAYDRSEEVNYRALVMLGKLVGIPAESQGAVPVVFMGDESSLYVFLLGDVDIARYLEPATEWFLALGGVGLPEWAAELFAPPGTLTPRPTSEVTREVTPTLAPSTPSPGGPPIHMAYFVERGCSECSRVSGLFGVLQKRFPNLVIHEFDILDGAQLNLCLSEALNVPERQRHDAPAIFVGVDYLTGADIQLDSTIEMVSQYAQTGAEPTWEGCGEGTTDLPPLPPWWGIITSGLIDGINPCAFATIIFFVSYLSFIERRGRDLLVVGVAFTLAVFASYLGFGMLLREILAELIEVAGTILRPILNTLMALFCLVLAVLSYADYRRARRGRVKDMALRLPDRLRRWVNATIRAGMRAETLNRLVGASLVSGVVVSFIELTCTGQVYVPIILGLSHPGYRARSVLALVVYCLAFVVPLIVVFTVSYKGTSSRELGRLLQRHTASVKLITALLFVGISVWLLYDVLRTWGVISPLVARAIG